MSTVDVIAGELLEVFRRNIQAAQHRLTFASPTLTITHPAGRRSIQITAPGSPGTHSLLARGGGDVSETTVNVVAAPSWSAFNIVCVGDSITAGTGDTANKSWHGRLKDNIGASMTALGTQTLGSYPHQGHSGWSWNEFNASGSPFWNGGGALDIPGYLTTIGANPDVIVWALGTNSVTDAIGAARTVTQQADIDEGVANTLFAAFTAELPAVKHVVLTGNPEKGRTQSDARRQMYLGLTRRVFEDFGGREGSNIWVCGANHLQIDPDLHYYDDVHPRDDGYVAMERGVRHWLAANL